MKEPQNPYAEIQAPENKPSLDAEGGEGFAMLCASPVNVFHRPFDINRLSHIVIVLTSEQMFNS